MVERDHSAYPEKLLLRENPLAISSISASGTDAARRALAPGQGLGWGWGGDAAVPGGRGDNPQEGPDPRFAEVSRSQSRSCLEDVDLPRDFLVGFRGGGGGGEICHEGPEPGALPPPGEAAGAGDRDRAGPNPAPGPTPPTPRRLPGEGETRVEPAPGPLQVRGEWEGGGEHPANHPPAPRGLPHPPPRAAPAPRTHIRGRVC